MGENDYDAAYQQFMMGGGTKGVPSSSTPLTHGKPSTPSTTVPSSLSSGLSTASLYTTVSPKKTPFRSTLKAFQGTLQRDWLDVDDNLGEVVHSIVNLRDRIYWSSEILVTHIEVVEQHDVEQGNKGVYLQPDDIDLALSHDMQQHEKMMAGARSLLSSLNTAQEALGRRLDEMMRYGGEAYDSHMAYLLEGVYRKLAEELYYKQVTVLKVLDSTNDHLLFSETLVDSSSSGSTNILIDDEDNPRYMAQTCWSKWSRMSQLKLVKEVLALK